MSTLDGSRQGLVPELPAESGGSEHLVLLLQERAASVQHAVSAVSGNEGLNSCVRAKLCEHIYEPDEQYLNLVEGGGNGMSQKDKTWYLREIQDVRKALWSQVEKLPIRAGSEEATILTNIFRSFRSFYVQAATLEGLFGEMTDDPAKLMGCGSALRKMDEFINGVIENITSLQNSLGDVRIAPFLDSLAPIMQKLSDYRAAFIGQIHQLLGQFPGSRDTFLHYYRELSPGTGQGGLPEEAASK